MVARQHFPELSRRVAHAVADIIATAELLKGELWENPARCGNIFALLTLVMGLASQAGH